MRATVSLDDYLQTCRRRVDALLTDPDVAPLVGPEHLVKGVHAYVRNGGKRLRPALVLLSCEACGGNAELALPAAAAVEIFHTWTLVHDDVIDNDSCRRGQPTVHTAATSWGESDFGLSGQVASEYGTSVAILTGDIQQGWAVSLLLRLLGRGIAPDLVFFLISRMTGHLLCRLIEGEMIDVQLPHMSLKALHQSDVLRMMALKTGALLEYSALAGAVIGTCSLPAPGSLHDSLITFSRHCGIAFQLQDDILGLTGDENKLGKPIGSDIYEGKRTVIILRALETGSKAQREHILTTLGNRSASREDISSVTCLVHDLGAVDYAREMAKRHILEAHNSLDPLPESPSRDHLHSLADMVVNRQH